ncbi:C-type lectin domain family 7 member A [Penaeus vannamei]|uniref:C-type lectin domain family 7 member A n=1 Tax=Penaeus vannamei TaxID=6689 RepID=UPI00387F8F6E
MRFGILSLVLAVCGAAEVNLQPRAGPTCDPPFLIVGTSKCVLVNNISVGSWHDMKHYCALLGAQLVKLDSASDFAALVNYINGEGLTKAFYWIGASDETDEGEWLWTDLSPVAMGAPFWSPTGSSCSETEPKGGANSDCAALNPNKFYYFDDLPCSNTAGVICEKM